jgi:hypothetical protein
MVNGSKQGARDPRYEVTVTFEETGSELFTSIMMVSRIYLLG